MKKTVYLDNAATSFPKAPGVVEAISDYLRETGASSGRSGHHLGIKAEKIVFRTRENLAKIFNIKDSSRIVFTSGATESLNTAIFGILEPGDEVIAGSMEHNSVMRPLKFLEKTKGIRIRIAESNSEGCVTVDSIKKKLTEKTKMVIINHASNVFGTISPVREIAEMLEPYRSRNGKPFFLVDAAQTAGELPIDVEKDGMDLLAVSGHKGLLGPTGTGALYIKEGVKCLPLKYGGTGSNSESMEHPEHFPDAMEAGTLNTTGIAGLEAATEYILSRGVVEIRNFLEKQARKLYERLKSIPGLVIYGTEDFTRRLSVFSVTLKNVSSSEAGYILDRQYGICTRSGLHCSPLAHCSMGTFPGGTLRLSPGLFTTDDELDFLAEALEKIARNESV